MKDLIAKLHSNAADQILATFSTLEMQLQGFAKSSYEKDLRIAELEAQIAGKPAGTDKLREAIANISNNQITEAWESCGGVDGFYKSFGYQQFAHAILDLAADTVASTALQAPVREVPGYKLVPVAITEAMHVAAVKAIIRSTGNDDCPPNVWRAMLAAAPLPAAPVQEPKP